MNCILTGNLERLLEVSSSIFESKTKQTESFKENDEFMKEIKGNKQVNSVEIWNKCMFEYRKR